MLKESGEISEGGNAQDQANENESIAHVRSSQTTSTHALLPHMP
jgi:hypothetical protein